MAFIFGRKNPPVLDRVDEDESSTGKAELEARHMNFKAGFITLKERMKSLAEQGRPDSPNHSKTRSRRGTEPSKAPQFATLQEMFSSRTKQLQHKSHCNCDDCGKTKKPKVPVMKLSKEDWNVKCWEERLRKKQATQRTERVSNNRLKKPEQQVEAFQDRVESVAEKLEKVKEGIPLDERLYQLSSNRILEPKSSHTWTQMLKEELAKGTHNREKLKSEYSAIGKKDVVDNKNVIISPLGRPIKKLFDDDDED